MIDFSELHDGGIAGKRKVACLRAHLFGAMGMEYEARWMHMERIGACVPLKAYEGVMIQGDGSTTEALCKE